MSDPTARDSLPGPAAGAAPGSTSGATSGAIPAAISVRREIWRSLVSMLRVYAHAAEVNHGVFAVHEVAGGVVLSGLEGEIAISLNCETGAGLWELRGNSGGRGDGRFSILADGSLDFNGEEKQLDSAAIDWVETLVRPADQREAS